MRTKFGPVSTCLCPKYITFCFKKLNNGRDDKSGRRETNSGLDNKKKFQTHFSKSQFLFQI